LLAGVCANTRHSEAACYRITQAQQRLDAARGELGSLEDRQAQLAGAPQAYADALAAEEQYLTHSADPRGAQRLDAIADERQQLLTQRPEHRPVSRHPAGLDSRRNLRAKSRRTLIRVELRATGRLGYMCDRAYRSESEVIAGKLSDDMRDRAFNH
jgi:hypothetical protein